MFALMSNVCSNDNVLYLKGMFDKAGGFQSPPQLSTPNILMIILLNLEMAMIVMTMIVKDIQIPLPGFKDSLSTQR